MARVIKKQQLVDDPWRHVSDDETLPAAPVIVSLARWSAERQSLSARGDVGVRLKNDEDIAVLAEDLSRLSVVAVEFPSFTDGRAYSQAQLLRRRYGYEGELRAVGEVLRDQLFFMQRSGIDAFELQENQDPDDALEAFSEIGVRYQPAVDEPLPLYRRGR